MEANNDFSFRDLECARRIVDNAIKNDADLSNALAVAVEGGTAKAKLDDLEVGLRRRKMEDGRFTLKDAKRGLEVLEAIISPIDEQGDANPILENARRQVLYAQERGSERFALHNVYERCKGEFLGIGSKVIDLFASDIFPRVQMPKVLAREVLPYALFAASLVPVGWVEVNSLNQMNDLWNGWEREVQSIYPEFKVPTSGVINSKQSWQMFGKLRDRDMGQEGLASAGIHIPLFYVLGMGLKFMLIDTTDKSKIMPSSRRLVRGYSIV